VTVRGTAVLVLIATALATLTLLEGGPLIPSAPPPLPEGSPLLDTEIAKVARVEWERGADRLTLVRTPAGWVDAAGQPWPADAVEVALDALASLHPRTVAAVNDGDLAEYGLAPVPERLRVLDDTGRELLALDIGNRNPAWTGVYARRIGATDVLLVGSLLRWELDKLRSVRQGTGTP
jgi:hypothetical protein